MSIATGMCGSGSRSHTGMAAPCSSFCDPMWTQTLFAEDTSATSTFARSLYLPRMRRMRILPVMLPWHLLSAMPCVSDAGQQQQRTCTHLFSNFTRSGAASRSTSASKTGSVPAVKEQVTHRLKQDTFTPHAQQTTCTGMLCSSCAQRTRLAVEEQVVQEPPLRVQDARIHRPSARRLQRHDIICHQPLRSQTCACVVCRPVMDGCPMKARRLIVQAC